MKTSYKRLNLEQRIIIEKNLALGLTYVQIGLLIGCHKSTVCRDVQLCKKKPYSALLASRIAVGNSSDRRGGKSKLLQNKKLGTLVFEKLKIHWSPEQIHLYLKKQFPNNVAMRISIETIYFHIYIHAKPELKKILISQLRQKRAYRGNSRRGAYKRTTIKDPVRIDLRPEEVKGRLIPGHWEGDLIMGKDRTSAIGTLNERSSRTVIIIKLKARDATSVRKAFEKEFASIPAQMKKSLTYDNGTEMAQHKLFTKIHKNTSLFYPSLQPMGAAYK